MAPGRVSGGRVIGATDDQQNAMRIKTDTFEVVGDDDMSGVRIQPSMVQHALRQVAGIDQSTLSNAFALPAGSAVNLFDV